MATGILTFWLVGLGLWWINRLDRKLNPARLRALILALAAWCATAASGQHLEVHGTHSWAIYYESGRVNAQEDWPFTLWVSSNRWCVQQGAEGAFGLGSTTFRWLLGPVAAAGVDSFYYPRSVTPRVTIPWLVFCSGLYFRNEPRWDELPFPWCCADVESAAHIYKAEVTFLDGTFKLPRSITFRVTQDRLRKAGQSRYLKFERLDRTSQLDRWMDHSYRRPPGLVAGQYRVLATTNLLGNEFPVSSELLVHCCRGRSPDTADPAETNRAQPASRHFSRTCEPFLVRRSTLQATSIVVRPGEVPLSLLPAHADVVDCRLQSRRWGVEYVLYRVRDGQWKLAPDAEVTNLFQAKVAEFRSEWIRRQAKRAPLYVGFAVLLLFPPAWVLWRAVNKKKPTADHKAL